MQDEPSEGPSPVPDGQGTPHEQRTQSAEAAGHVIDRYTLLDELGEGGMGTVWRASQVEPVRREVALKVIKLGMDTREVVTRFEAERQALALMDHPHIAKVLDGGATTTGRPFFVMELVEGTPITEFCDVHELDLRRRLELFSQVCEAIQHAHHKGIIHRDIKPSNVLVSEQDGQPVPKVIDFGIAKATSAELTQQTMLTQHAQIIGTPEYMAPEQADAGSLDIDTRADVYSLGVLLYELLTGTKPFDMRAVLAKGYGELLRTIREVDPARPSTRVSTLAGTEIALPPTPLPSGDALSKRLRGDLDWIVMRAMEKERDRRYETPSELADDVARYLHNEPVLAAPPSTTYRWRKFVRRRKKTVAVVAAMVFLLLSGSIGTGIGLWRTVRANERLDEALGAKTQALNEKDEALRDKIEALAAKEQALDDLELVSGFQSDQFFELDAHDMGRKLRQSLIDATPESERAVLTIHLDRLNWTDLSLLSLRETFFDRSLAAIDARFADQPEVRTKLLQTLGDTLQKLGLYESALGPMGRALALRRAELGDLHPETLASVNRLGTLVSEMGDFETAEARYREAYEGRTEVLGSEHRDTLKSLNNIAQCLARQARFPEAEAAQRDCLARRRASLGEDHRDTLNSMNNLGLLLSDQGRLDEAEEVLRETFEARGRLLGEDHLETITTLATLASILCDRKDYEAAEPLSRKVLEATRRTLGNDHSRTLSSINNLASNVLKLGRVDEAEKLYREANEGMRRVLGEDHYLSHISDNNLAGFLADRGRFDQAEPLFRRAIAGTRESLGSAHPTPLGIMLNFAGYLVDEGRSDEAEPLYWESLEGLYASVGIEHSHTRMAFNGLAKTFERREAQANEAEDGLAFAAAQKDMGRLRLMIEWYDDAEVYFNDALLILEENGAPEADILMVRVLLGHAVAAQGRHAEAEPLLLASARAILAVEPTQHEPAATAMEKVIALYDEWDRVDPDAGHDVQAGEWRVRMEAWRDELEETRRP